MKKVVSILLLLASLLCMAAPAMATEIGFFDVPADADYAEAVAWCFEEKLMQGVSDTSFAPNETLTRAMVATVLYRAEGEPTVAGVSSFSDVALGQWYSNAVIWATQQGIFHGYGNGLFGTDDPITKEQLDLTVRRYQGETSSWRGDPALAVPATRAEAAVAFYTSLRKKEPEGKVLVAYFSATNTTEGVAQHIADILGADLYEITPAQSYTSADLNWHDSSSRTTIEMNDPDSRPAISGNVENMEDYDTIFLGYPIWWGQAPRIICTFLESYNLDGKTIVPFCTSNSSGIGSSDTSLHSLTGQANWLAGRRFGSGASRSAVEIWLSSLELLPNL